jgi:hypothetical protein
MKLEVNQLKPRQLLLIHLSLPVVRRIKTNKLLKKKRRLRRNQRKKNQNRFNKLQRRPLLLKLHQPMTSWHKWLQEHKRPWSRNLKRKLTKLKREPVKQFKNQTLPRLTIRKKVKITVWPVFMIDSKDKNWEFLRKIKRNL